MASERVTTERVKNWVKACEATGNGRTLTVDIARDLLDARESVAALTAERDAYKRAKAENDERFMLERDQARRERDEARRQLAEERARVADTGDCRTCKWADAAVCHNPEGKRKNSPVWTWCGHALAEDLVTRLDTSPPCPGYTKK